MADDEDALWRMTQYEGFEIHVAPLARDHEGKDASDGFTYVGFVCHPGADPKLPGHAVPFHADGDVGFERADDALEEGTQIGRTIVDGTHPDLTVLPLVTGGA